LTSHSRESDVRRVLAIEDGPFSKSDRYCLLLGVETIKNSIQRFVLDHIHVDGTDATRKVTSLARRTSSLDLIILPSISLGGFNVVNAHKLHQETKLPILVVNPVRPDLGSVKKALRRHFTDWKEKIALFHRMGPPHTLLISRRETAYFYCVGLPPSKAASILRRMIQFGKRPEPLRIARIVARALGDSPSVEALRRI
jgi:endonuclease V-like protein UPF0215 family